MPLCYGGVHAHLPLLTYSLFHYLTYEILLSHMHCPLCGAATGNVDDIWEHLLCHCSGSERVAEDKGLQFLHPTCKALGVSLTLYSMIHHVASFIWALL